MTDLLNSITSRDFTKFMEISQTLTHEQIKSTITTRSLFYKLFRENLFEWLDHIPHLYEPDEKTLFLLEIDISYNRTDLITKHLSELKDINKVNVGYSGSYVPVLFIALQRDIECAKKLIENSHVDVNVVYQDMTPKQYLEQRYKFIASHPDYDKINNDLKLKNILEYNIMMNIISSR